jgi:hypothetical protein
MRLKLLSVTLVAIAGAMPASASADKWTVSCGAGTLAAQEKNAKNPYELLEVRRFVLKVDVVAKTCAVEAAEAAFTKGKATPVALKADADAKCSLNVTNKGRVFMDGRANLKGDKVLSSPILTINYEVRKQPPAAGSPDSMGKYFIISGFPTNKIKGAQIDKDAKVSCTQAK